MIYERNRPFTEISRTHGNTYLIKCKQSNAIVIHEEDIAINMRSYIIDQATRIHEIGRDAIPDRSELIKVTTLPL
jgi:hypothetical protein